MTSDISAVAEKTHFPSLTRRTLFIAGAVVVLLLVALMLFRQRAVDVQFAPPAYAERSQMDVANQRSGEIANRAKLYRSVRQVAVRKNAKIQERQKYVDLLDARLQLRDANISLMRQTGELDGWIQRRI